MSAIPTVQAPITPFWERLPQIARYPLRGGAPLTVLIYAVLITLVGFMMFGGVLRVLLLVAFYKYAFECLRSSANGEEEAPEYAINVDDRVGYAQLQMQVMFFLLLLLGWWLAGPTGVMIGMALISLALPGATMSLAIDMNLWHALNPATWLAVLARIPWPYLGVTLLLFVFGASQENATGWLAGIMPSFLAVLITQLGANYTILVSFHLMGWLIYQYHEELGYEPQRKLVLKRSVDDPDQPLIDRAEALAGEGRISEARDYLAGEIRSRGATPAVHERYRKLLRALDDRPALQAHGQQYLGVLLAQDKHKPALDLLRECQAADPGFMPAEAEHVGRLARKAVECGHSRNALQLLAGFQKAFPKSKEIPANLLYAARLLFDKFNEPDKARALLQMLQQKYPEHACRAETDELLGQIERLQPRTP